MVLIFGGPHMEYYKCVQNIVDGAVKFGSKCCLVQGVESLLRKSMGTFPFADIWIDVSLHLAAKGCGGKWQLFK